MNNKLFIHIIPIYCLFVMVISCSASFAAHDETPQVFTFSGTINHETDGFLATHPLPDFKKNGIVYFTLTSSNWSNITQKITVQRQDCTAYQAVATNLQVNTEYGPWAIKAGSYSLNLLSVVLEDVEPWAYTVKVKFYEQLSPGDPEPNNDKLSAPNLGVLYGGSSISGHIGYGTCNSSDAYDYLQFQVAETGEYNILTTYDSSFDERTDCHVTFTLYEEKNDGWIIFSNQYDDPSGTSHDPLTLSKDTSYQLYVRKNDKCNTKNDNDNGRIGGSYDVTLNLNSVNEGIKITEFYFEDLDKEGPVQPPVFLCGESVKVHIKVESFSLLPANDLKLVLVNYDSDREFKWHFDLFSFASKTITTSGFKILYEEAGTHRLYTYLYDGPEIIDAKELEWEVVCYDNKPLTQILLLLLNKKLQ